MDGMSREEAIEVVDVPDLCSALLERGNVWRMPRVGNTTVKGWSNQRNFTNYYHWRNSSLSSLRGYDCQSCNSGDLLPSPVEALVLLRTSLEAVVAQAL